MDLKLTLLQFLAFVAPVAIPAVATEVYEGLQHVWTWLDRQKVIVKRIGAAVLAFVFVTAFNTVGLVLPPEIAANITELTSEHIVQFGMAALAFLFKDQNETKALKARS